MRGRILGGKERQTRRAQRKEDRAFVCPQCGRDDGLIVNQGYIQCKHCGFKSEL